MALRALLKYRNIDSTKDINDRFSNLFEAGIFSGGEVVPVSGGGLKVRLVAPWKLMTKYGMIVEETSDSKDFSTPADTTTIITVRAIYFESKNPELSVLSYSSADFNALSLEEKSNHIIFAEVVVPVGSIQITQSYIKYNNRDIVDKVGRNVIRGIVTNSGLLPGPNVNQPGDIWVVADGLGDPDTPPNMYGWDGARWVCLTDYVSIRTMLLAHRSNYYSNEKHLTDNEKDAVYDPLEKRTSTIDPSKDNPFVDSADPRIPTQNENDALVGSDGNPSSTNTYVTEEYPLAITQEKRFTVLPQNSFVTLKTSADGRIYLGFDEKHYRDNFKLYTYDPKCDPDSSLYDQSTDPKNFKLNREYVNINGVPVAILGVYKSESESPLAPADIDELGFYKGENLYIKCGVYQDISTIVNSNFTLLYGKYQVLGKMPIDVLLKRHITDAQVSSDVIEKVTNIKGRPWDDLVPENENNAEIRKDVVDLKEYVSSVFIGDHVVGDFSNVENVPEFLNHFQKNIGIPQNYVFENLTKAAYTYTYNDDGAGTTFGDVTFGISIPDVQENHIFIDGAGNEYIINDVLNSNTTLRISMRNGFVPETIDTSRDTSRSGSVKVDNNPRQINLSTLQFIAGRDRIQCREIEALYNEFHPTTRNVAFQIRTPLHSAYFREDRVRFYGGFKNTGSGNRSRIISTGSGKIMVTGFFTDLVLICKLKTPPTLFVHVDGFLENTLTFSGALAQMSETDDIQQQFISLLSDSLDGNVPHTVEINIQDSSDSFYIYGFDLIRTPFGSERETTEISFTNIETDLTSRYFNLGSTEREYYVWYRFADGCISVNGSKIYVSSYDGLFLSTNGGVNWTQIFITDLTGHIRGIATKGNKIFAATSEGLFLSNDSGLTWEHALTTPSNGVFISSDDVVYVSTIDGLVVSTDLIDWSTFYLLGTLVRNSCAIGLNRYAATNNGLYISDNFGDFIDPPLTVSDGLGSTQVNDVVAVERGIGELIYVGSNNGVSVIDTSESGFLSSVLPGGLSNNTVYYVIKVDNNTLKLALTSEDAANNIPIDIIDPGYGDFVAYLDDKIFVSADVSFVDNTITISGHGLYTGNDVKLYASVENMETAAHDSVTIPFHSLYTGYKFKITSSNYPPAPLTFTDSYYLIVVDEHVVKFATSLANAYAGIAITLTSTGLGTHVFHPVWDNRLPGNQVYDIFVDGATICISTDKGIYLSLNYGITWINKNQTNGLWDSVVGASWVVGAVIYSVTNERLSVSSDQGGFWNSYRFGEEDSVYDPAVFGKTGIKVSTFSNRSPEQVALLTKGKLDAFSLTYFEPINIDPMYDKLSLHDHGFLTGFYVLFSVLYGAAPAGLTNNSLYYVIKVDENTIRLSTTIEDAINGRFINILDFGSGKFMLSGSPWVTLVVADSMFVMDVKTGKCPDAEDGPVPDYNTGVLVNILIQGNDPALFLPGRAFVQSDLYKKDTLTESDIIIGAQRRRGSVFTKYISRNLLETSTTTPLVDFDGSLPPSGSITLPNKLTVGFVNGADKFRKYYKVGDIVKIIYLENAPPHKEECLRIQAITKIVDDYEVTFESNFTEVGNSTGYLIHMASSFGGTFDSIREYNRYTVTEMGNRLLIDLNANTTLPAIVADHVFTLEDGTTTLAAKGVKYITTGIDGIDNVLELANSDSFIRIRAVACQLNLMTANTIDTPIEVSIDGCSLFPMSIPGNGLANCIGWTNARYQTHEILITNATGLRLAGIILHEPTHPKKLEGSLIGTQNVLASYEYNSPVTDISDSVLYATPTGAVAIDPYIMGGYFEDGSGIGDAPWNRSMDFVINPYFGKFSNTNREGAFFTYVFFGSGIEIEYLANSIGGRPYVYLNGVFAFEDNFISEYPNIDINGIENVSNCAVVDMYSPNIERRRFSVTGLSQTLHTLKIQLPESTEPSGNKNPASSDTYINVITVYEVNSDYKTCYSPNIGYRHKVGVGDFVTGFDWVRDERNFDSGAIVKEEVPVVRTVIYETRSQKINLSMGSTSIDVVFTKEFDNDNYTLNPFLSNTVDIWPEYRPLTVTAISSSGFSVAWNTPLESENYVLHYTAIIYS